MEKGLVRFDKNSMVGRLLSRTQLVILVIIILFAAAFLRLYRIENYGYAGDQARDMLEVHQWLTSGKIPLQGPSTSMGTFHLGPLYYYLIAPFIIIFNNDPIGPVYFEIFDSLLLVVLGFLLLYKFVDFATACIFTLLITLSPFAIALSRGSWNPNPQLLVTVLFIFSFMQFVKTNAFKYIFISALLLGLGVQMHYTFLTNVLSLFLMILLFKRNSLLNYKMWFLLVSGFLLPLTPFLIGQFLNGFSDINQAYLFVVQSGSQKRVFILKSLFDRFSFPFSIFFPYDHLSWFFRLLAQPFYLFLLGSVVLIAFLKTHLSLFTKIVLIVFFSGEVLSMLMRTPFYMHYHYSMAILALILISIYISFLYRYAKIKFLWLPVLIIFIVWEVFLLPKYYGVSRPAKVIFDVSKKIIEDINLRPKDPIVGIYAFSPVTLSAGLEYRYMLEKEGIKTFSASREGTADYVIFEDSNKIPMDFKVKEIDRRMIPLQQFEFEYGGTLVKYARLFRVEKIKPEL